ncbi:hypothetical protein D3C87_1735130 [compost metagenome]
MFSFQFTAHIHRAHFLKLVGNLFTLLIHTNRYNMYMAAVNISMFEHHKRLLSVTHLLHIFFRHFPVPIVTYLIFRIGIERDMHRMFLGIAVCY